MERGDENEENSREKSGKIASKSRENQGLKRSKETVQKAAETPNRQRKLDEMWAPRIHR